jgi:hypothetical protein
VLHERQSLIFAFPPTRERKRIVYLIVTANYVLRPAEIAGF